MAVTYEDLVGHFGAANVARATPEELAPLGLPEEARRALVEVGLPRSLDDDYFVADPPALLGSAALKTVGATGRFCQIGHSPGSLLAVNAVSGEVWTLSRYPDSFEPGLVNSTLPLFIECTFRSWVLLEQVPADYAADKAVAQRWAVALEQTIREIDPRAIASPDSFYYDTIHDIRIGI